MKTASYLLHPIFLASLLVLILNDHYLKYEYHNGLTGKLSDIAGLVVLPLFLFSLFPGKKKAMLIFSALFFIWWKSPFSQPAMDLFFDLSGICLVRVMDYTDLWALAILPLLMNLQPVSLKRTAWVRCGRAGMGLVAFAALCATTPPRQLFYGDYNSWPINRSFRTKTPGDEILQRLKNAGLQAERDTALFMPVWGDLYFRKGDTGNHMVPLASTHGLQVFSKYDPPDSTFRIRQMVFGQDTVREVRFTIRRHEKRNVVFISGFQYGHFHMHRKYGESEKITNKFGRLIRKRIREVVE